MPEMKQSILANIDRALETGEKASPHEKRTEKILSSVKDSLKTLVTQGRESFNKAREKTRTKIFGNIKTH